MGIAGYGGLDRVNARRIQRSVKKLAHLELQTIALIEHGHEAGRKLGLKRHVFHRIDYFHQSTHGAITATSTCRSTYRSTDFAAASPRIRRASSSHRVFEQLLKFLSGLEHVPLHGFDAALEPLGHVLLRQLLDCEQNQGVSLLFR